MFLNRRFPNSVPVLASTLPLVLITFIFAGLAVAASPQCTAPYVNVQGAGNAATEPTGELTIQSVNIGEPFDGNCSHRSITFVLKVNTMDPGNSGMVTPIYNGEWVVLFSAPDTNGTSRTLLVSWNTTQVPTGEFSYGFVDTSTGQNVNRSTICVPPALTCPVTGMVTPDGTITIVLTTTGAFTFTPTTGSAFSVNLNNPGTNLSSIKGITYLCACAGGSGAVSTQSQTVGNGSYTLQGNLSCSAPPVAALAADVTSGNAPLTVNFNASGSNIPAGGCGTINSYLFDFGDMTGVTQATPTTSHTYTGAGTYPARVRVTSTVGLTSANIAEKVITVNSAGPPQLTSIVSRVTHGLAGDFDIVLPQPPAVRGVECRSTGGSYKMVFTFLNNLTGVASASFTTGAGSIASSVLGPNSNQYTVNLTGVTNIQYVTVTLNNATDSTGASGPVTGTGGFLIGDTSGNGLVNSTDVSQAQAQSGQAVTSSNFRRDINANGLINSTDVSAVQAKSGTGLTPAP